MNETDKRALGCGAVALIALLTVYLNIIPAFDYATRYARELSLMEPAAGSSTEAPDTAHKVTMFKIYESEYECERETKEPCEWVLCEGDYKNRAQARINMQEMREKVCSAQEWTGWRTMSMPVKNNMAPLLELMP